MALVDLLKPKEDPKKSATNNSLPKSFFEDLPPECIGLILSYLDFEDQIRCLSLSKALYDRFVKRIYRSMHISDIKFKNNAISKHSSCIREVDARYAYIYPNGSVNLHRLIKNNTSVKYHLKCPSLFLYNEDGTKKYENCVLEHLTIDYSLNSACILEDSTKFEKLEKDRAFSKIKSIHFNNNLKAAKNLFPLLKDQVKSITIENIEQNYLKKPLQNILNFSNLTELRLLSCKLRLGHIQNIFNTASRSLKHLEINSYSNSGNGMKAPKLYIDGNKCKSLRSLTLDSIMYRIEFQNSLKKLSTLRLQSYSLNQLSIQQENIPNVRELSLISCNSLTAKLMKLILRSTSITSLKLDTNDCETLLLREIYPSKKIRNNIIKMDITRATFDDYFLNYLVFNCKNLEYLILKDCESLSANRSVLLNDKQFTHKIESLSKLILNKEGLEEEFIEFIIKNSINLTNVTITAIEGKWLLHCLSKYPKIAMKLEV
ncbi:hypothetical protein K502DRAFT_367197 [Neoconidiobolus thromboides FSU 785]|nr:hypothetical protein K502DRAFT_367197 [Neoconidiobolus thromboides FSU 785]